MVLEGAVKVFLKRLSNLLRGKWRKSAGVWVTPAVHADLKRGNRYRQVEDWLAAAKFYHKALDRDSSLSHIWVQLGHMYKEGGRPLDASRAYLEALRASESHPEMLGWLQDIVGRLATAHRRPLIEAIYELQGRTLPADLFAPRLDVRPSASDEVVFDVSDLVAYFFRARRPTGIQRVQIAVINAALDGSEGPVRVCCSVEASAHWVEIGAALFRCITKLAVSPDEGTEDEWHDIVHDLGALLAFAAPFNFGPRAKLVNLGTSWWLQNYFLQVRNAQLSHQLEYAPFIHDLIPFLAPQHCVQGLVEDFNSWIVGVFDHANHYLVNSQATRADLIRVAAMLGKAVCEDDVTVIRLDGVFSSPDFSGSNIIESAGLSDRNFVLLVSTIESRKGHLVALKAWQHLLVEHGDAVPDLVCVGNDGWLNARFYQTLEQDQKLKRRVKLLSGISDADLACLYASCLFTIYPSAYEGWGLPITEALSFGKVVITADNSSLPEAGGNLAVYAKTGDCEDLARLVAQMCQDANKRSALELRIRREFSPRTWSTVANQVLEATRTKYRDEGDSPRLRLPTIQPGRWISLGRVRGLPLQDMAALRQCGQGERLRVGTGWASPESDGCWLIKSAAELRFWLCPEGPNCRMTIKMECRAAVSWSVRVNGALADEGIARTDYDSHAMTVCSTFPLPATGGAISIVLGGVALDEMRQSESGALLKVQGCIALDVNDAANLAHDFDAPVVEYASLAQHQSDSVEFVNSSINSTFKGSMPCSAPLRSITRGQRSETQSMRSFKE